MTAKTSKATEESQIRKLIDDRVNAVRARDIKGATSGIAPDIVVFDVVDPLQRLGSESSKKRAEEWFSSFQTPIGYEIRNLSIDVGDDVAFAHGLSHVSATKTDGAQLDMWWRSTICFRKIDGAWIVTHEHNSVPFNPGNGKASIDLKPDQS